MPAVLLLLLALVLLPVVSAAQPFDSAQGKPPLVVLSSNATRAALLSLGPAIKRATNRDLDVKFANSADLRTRIEKGEAFDVAILTAAVIDDLASKGRLVAASRVDVARAGVGVAIKKGAKAPDIATAEGLKRAFVNTRSIAYVGQGATASILRGIFDRFGIAAVMQPKTKLVLGAAEAVAEGEAEMGVTQISEILPVAGASLVGGLPEELQVYTLFKAAVATGSAAPDAATQLIRTLGSPEGAAAIKASGMQPPTAADRLPPIPVSQMNDAQKKAAAEFKVIRNGAEVSGPFFPLLRSPELMVRAGAMGEYLRYRSVLPPRLSEFVILLTARDWTQQYEWNAHYAIALKAGVSQATANAIAEGKRPPSMTAEEETLYDFCQDLIRNKSVNDPIYARALDRFGEQGVVDTVGIVGYYSMLAMVLNTARTPAGTANAPVLAPIPK